MIYTSNLERWKYYCETLVSPNSFIEFGFYFIISSALQRRVWFGGDRAPLFSNLYIFLVADPGIGKGVVSKQIDYVLRYHKYLGRGDKLKGAGLSDDELPLLFPMAPNTITFEALVLLMGKSMRSIARPGEKPPIYPHCSLSCVLEELASLLRKNTDDTVRLLLQVYDCISYRSETIGRGSDYINNSCFNLLAGTQPSHISKIFGSGLLTDGLASRTILLFEDKQRFRRKDPPYFGPEQRAECKIIIDHIRKLADLYGPVTLTPEADAYFDEWWLKIKETPVNKSPLLKGFQERENMTVMKLAMAVHYADKTDNIITLEDFQKAASLLEWAERRMHLALTLDGKNIMSQVTKEIVKYLQANGPQLQKDLLVEFYDSLPDPAKENLGRILIDLVGMNKITLDGMRYKALSV